MHLLHPFVAAALLVGAGCVAPATTSVDSSLPEAAHAAPDEDPLAVLTTAASSLDPTQRARALELLILNTEPSGGEWGPRGLADPDPWSQRLAARALTTRLTEPESIELLRNYAAQPYGDPYVRGQVALRLHEVGHGIDDLGDQWRDQPTNWQAAPLALAAAAAGDAEALALVEEVLRTGDLPLEIDFVLDIGRSGLASLIPALEEGAKVVEPELHLAFAAAQLSLGDAAGEGALRKALSDDNVLLRLEALDYLTAIDDPAATALLRKARSQTLDVVRWYASLALLRQGEGTTAQFEEAMSHPDPEVRSLAVRFAAELEGDSALRQRGTDRRSGRVTRAVLRGGVLDPNHEVQLTALRALAKLGMDGEETEVTMQLGHQYLAVRLEAAGALLLGSKRS